MSGAARRAEIVRLWSEGATFAEIGREMRVSGQRVRQIFNAELRRLRHAAVWEARWESWGTTPARVRRMARKYCTAGGAS